MTAHAVVAHDLAGNPAAATSLVFPSPSLRCKATLRTPSIARTPPTSDARPRPAAMIALPRVDLFRSATVSLSSSHNAQPLSLRYVLAKMRAASCSGTLLSTYIPGFQKKFICPLSIRKKTLAQALRRTAIGVDGRRRHPLAGDRLETEKIRNVHRSQQVVFTRNTFSFFFQDRQETFAYLRAAPSAIHRRPSRAPFFPLRNSNGLTAHACHGG